MHRPYTNNLDSDSLLYRVFIIRIWEEQTPADERETRRFTLEIPATGQRHGFITSEALLKGLRGFITDLTTEHPKRFR